LVAALDIKTRVVPTVSSINSSQYCKASHFLLLQILICGGGGGRWATVRFAPDVPWAKAGPGYYALLTGTDVSKDRSAFIFKEKNSTNFLDCAILKMKAPRPFET
jgi:hypothetical protein